MTTSRIEKSPHRGWSPHLTTRRHRLAQPKREVVGICVTSGDLGTHGMHPPRKRSLTYNESGITAKNLTVTFSCAGGHSGPPLRGEFVSRRGITTVEPTAEQKFRNIRRPRHARIASAAQARTALFGHTAHTRRSLSRRARTGAFACPHTSALTNPRYGDGGYKYR
jgi:hypothetical protein